MMSMLFLVAPMVIIMEGGFLADGYGRYMQNVCNGFMELPHVPEDICHGLAVERFRSLFPETALPVEECVMRSEVEALMWARSTIAAGQTDTMNG